MSRVATWLVDEVGIGNSFTKQDLRSAVPGVEQADRRMRDLRKYGWRIDTSTDDVTLRTNELRLVEIGEHVWSSDFKPRRSTTIGAADRRAALATAGYCCMTCGIGLGQTYLEYPGEAARLVVGSVQPVLVVCARCLIPDEHADETGIQRAFDALSPEARERVLAELASPGDSRERAVASLLRRRPDLADRIADRGPSSDGY